MTRRLAGACLFTMPLVAACAFVMDFDELQKGNGAAATGGSAGQNGKTGGAAGTDASVQAGGASGAGGAGGGAGG